MLTMNDAHDVIADGAVAIDGEVITAVGTWSDLRAAHPDAEVGGSATALVMPGMINAHQHLTGDRLVRSVIPDTITSHEAIFDWSVPIHAAHTERDDELSALLSLHEALCNGVTTTIEAGTVAHPAAVARAMRTIGARGSVGCWGWDVEGGPFAAPADEVLARQRAVVEMAPPGGRVEGWVTLVGHDLMSDDLVVRSSALARELGVRITFHISPTTADADAYLARTGRRPLRHLHDLGVLGPHVLLAHAVHVDDDELDCLAASGAAVAACPWAYLRLAQRVTVGGRHDDMLRRGVPVALGSDAENASDAIDPIRTGALFVGLLRDRSGDPAEFSATTALRLLTIDGARAIGMADRIGSLEVGKQADVVTLRTDGPEWMPRSPRPELQLLWASSGASVDEVHVAGRQVVAGRRCTTIDVPALAAEAQARQAVLGQTIRP